MEWFLVVDMPDDGEVLGWSEKHGFNVIEAADHFIDRRSGDREYFNGDVYCYVTHWARLEAPQDVDA